MRVRLFVAQDLHGFHAGGAGRLHERRKKSSEERQEGDADEGGRGARLDAPPLVGRPKMDDAETSLGRRIACVRAA